MKIKQFRNNSAEKLTQKDMAKILQLSERQYRRIECGTSLPDIRTAIPQYNRLHVHCIIRME